MKYFNNAGAGLISNNTLNVITSYLKEEQETGAYIAANLNKSRTEEFYENVAMLINAEYSSEIAFVDSASRGWNLAIQGLNLNPNDTILTLSSEFGTNLITLYDFARKQNANIKVMQCEQDGNFSLSHFEEELKRGVKFIALSHAAAHGSIINPIEEIGRLALKYNALFIVDGCQSVGQFPIDVQKLGCHVYIGTGRKWLSGPRGTGFLFVKKGAPITSSHLDLAGADLVLSKSREIIGLDIRKDARQFELWERSIANMLGLSHAIHEYLQSDPLKIAKTIKELSSQIRKEIVKNKNIGLIGTVDSISGIVGFYLLNPDRESHVKERFLKEGFNFSTMSDWDCPLHFPKNGAKTIFRFSPNHNTAASDIRTLCNILSEI